MTNTDIYSVLESKPHNPHYLKRYWKFIQSCSNDGAKYTEKHHICPKAKDLFPMFINVKYFPWNSIDLTARQHFLAHRMLWKAYGGSMAYAFWSMCNLWTSKNLKRDNLKINSKTYQRLKTEINLLNKKLFIGKASYVDILGVSHCVETNHPKVLSGEYLSTTLGRKQPWAERSIESMEKRRQNCKDAKWAQYPIRVKTLYKSELKKEVSYTKEGNELDRYYKSGWVDKATREYISQVRISQNNKRSSESRTRAAKNISLAADQRKAGIKRCKLYYKLGVFMELDPKFDSIIGWSVVFLRTGNSRRVFGDNGLIKIVDKDIPMPPGYSEFRRESLKAA
jgi:hypothetical protein